MSYSIIKFEQPAGAFFFMALPAAEVLRIARPNPRVYDPLTHTSTGGIQREATARRIAEIADYCGTTDAAFPSAIILSVPEENFQLAGDESSIKFVGEGQFADVVDGQHRLLGLGASGRIADFVLPVVLMLDATDEQKALIFATINGKQNKVNASLIYELFAVAEGRTPQKIAHEIVRGLNATEGSPWFERLKMLGRASRPYSNETITQGTFARELMPHLSSEPARDFDAVRRKLPLPPDPKSPVFRRYLESGEDSTILRTLMNLFSAQREVWSSEWDNPRESILSKTTGFMGTMWALASLVGHGFQAKSLSQDTFAALFERVKQRLEGERVDLTADEFPSSAQGIARFRDYLQAAAKESGSVVEASTK